MDSAILESARQVAYTVADGVAANAIANVASIFGLLFTIYVAVKIKNIRRSFLVKARLPELAKSFERHVRMINRYLNDSEQESFPVHEEMARCRATLDGIRRLVSGPVVREIRKTQRNIKRYRRADKVEDMKTAQQIYLDLLELETRFGDLEKELQWS